jgi:hypothetical protein
MQRRRDAAERAEPGTRAIGQAQPTLPVAPDQHDCVDARANRRGGMFDQRRPAEQRLGLVAAEAGRSPAGDDRTEDQRITSNLTGTDFPAGT